MPLIILHFTFYEIKKKYVVKLKLKLKFTNNAQVFYKPHSLSTGSGGSGVRNSRHKQRHT